MPALKNLRHEAFAQLIVRAPKRGMSNAQCYRDAGYQVPPGPGCDASASKLLSSGKVQARIAELIQPTVRKARATVDTLAEQFDEVFRGAMGSAQFGAAGQAAAAKSKLLGFMRERLEVGGVGEFDRLNSREEITDKLLETQTPAEAIEHLEELRRMIEERAAHYAKNVTPAMPAPSFHHGEADRALRDLRPRKHW
jgi:hypothetical protein